MITVEDKTLECVKCGQSFTFTAAEAKSFLDKGLTNAPKKCPSCRAKDRAKKQQRVRAEVQCAKCGVTIIVPFEPDKDSQGKPVRPLYCIEHFEQTPGS